MLTPAEIELLADALAERLAARLADHLAGRGPDNESLVDIHDAAQVLHCSVATVERRVRDGEIPSLKIGRLRRFRRSDLLTLSKKGGPHA